MHLISCSFSLMVTFTTFSNSFLGARMLYKICERFPPEFFELSGSFLTALWFVYFTLHNIKIVQGNYPMLYCPVKKVTGNFLILHCPVRIVIGNFPMFYCAVKIVTENFLMLYCAVKVVTGYFPMLYCSVKIVTGNFDMLYCCKDYKSLTRDKKFLQYRFFVIFGDFISSFLK